MADLTIAGVVLPVPTSTPSLGSRPLFYQAGAGGIGQGVPFYLDSATNTYLPADSTTQAKASVVGISVGEALEGQFFPGMGFGGQITLGTTVMVAAMQYVLSHTTGKVAPYTDLATGDWVTYLFWTDAQTPKVCTLNVAALPVQWP